MTPQGFRAVSAVFFFTEMFLLATADAANPSRSSPFAVTAGSHQSYGMDIFPHQSENRAVENVFPAPATRSSFMARWEPVAGALGYRLDVATDSVFVTYVPGYHNLDVGKVIGRVVTGLKRGTTYFYRVRAYDAVGLHGNSEVRTGKTLSSAGLTIDPTFDSSITSNPNAVAIEAMIERAVSIYELSYRDPFTVSILFRYATTAPNGDPLGPGTLAQSNYTIYSIAWNTFINALVADAKTADDATANASLPGSALSASIVPSSAGGRAVELNTPGALCTDGTICGSGPFYDGIITLNANQPFQFSRPPGGSNYDAQRSTEHEMDEVMCLGSDVNQSANYRPQDLFSWSAPGTRNFSSSGSRYFSINSGTTNIVSFNQDPSGDFGDWFSPSCPQANPYVQDAFSCPGQYSDITANSPEGINLDVVGYDPASELATDYNGDYHPDLALFNTSTRKVAFWYLNNNVFIGSAYGPTPPVGWQLVDTADFNGDGHPDYLLYNPSTRQTAIWYLNGNTFLGNEPGPTIASGYTLFGAADFNGDGRPDYLLYNPTTRRTAIWYLNNYSYAGSAYGPVIATGYNIAGLADFNGDGKVDLVLFNPSTLKTAIWYLNGAAYAGSAYGPAIASGYQLIGAADFNIDGKPDYLLYNPSTQHSAIWYLNNNLYLGSAYGPTVANGYTIAAP